MDMAELAREAGESTPPAPEDALKRLGEMGERLVSLDREIDGLVKRLETLKALRQRIATEDMPELFDECRMDRIGLVDEGVDLVVRRWCSARIPDERRREAFDWLIGSGNGGIIKTHLDVSFGVGELDEANRLLENIRPHTNREIEVSQSVHNGTLVAFIKSQIEEGEVVPLDLFGATVGRIVKPQKRNG